MLPKIPDFLYIFWHFWKIQPQFSKFHLFENFRKIMIFLKNSRNFIYLKILEKLWIFNFRKMNLFEIFRKIVNFQLFIFFWNFIWNFWKNSTSIFEISFIWKFRKNCEFSTFDELVLGFFFFHNMLVMSIGLVHVWWKLLANWNSKPKNRSVVSWSVVS